MARLKRSPKQPSLRSLSSSNSNNPNNIHANNSTWKTTTDFQRHPSPALTANLNLPSNNPFRNRAASPANSLPSPVTATFDNIPSTAPPERPISRNPFLDQSQLNKLDATTVQVRQTSPQRGPYIMAARSSPRKQPLTGHAVDLFVGHPPLIQTTLKQGNKLMLIVHLLG